MKIIYTALILFFASVTFANDYIKVVHIQPDVEHIQPDVEDQNTIYLVVQNKDFSWTYGTFLNGDFDGLFEVTVSSDNNEKSIGIDFGDNHIRHIEVVGFHQSLDCMPFCYGCINSDTVGDTASLSQATPGNGLESGGREGRLSQRLVQAITAVIDVNLAKVSAEKVLELRKADDRVIEGITMNAIVNVVLGKCKTSKSGREELSSVLFPLYQQRILELQEDEVDEVSVKIQYNQFQEVMIDRYDLNSLRARLNCKMPETLSLPSLTLIQHIFGEYLFIEKGWVELAVSQLKALGCKQGLEIYSGQGWLSYFIKNCGLPMITSDSKVDSFVFSEKTFFSRVPPDVSVVKMKDERAINSTNHADFLVVTFPLPVYFIINANDSDSKDEKYLDDIHYGLIDHIWLKWWKKRGPILFVGFHHDQEKKIKRVKPDIESNIPVTYVLAYLDELNDGYDVVPLENYPEFSGFPYNHYAAIYVPKGWKSKEKSKQPHETEDKADLSAGDQYSMTQGKENTASHSGKMKVGFPNYGNTCFANGALKAILGAYPDAYYAGLCQKVSSIEDEKRPILIAFLNLVDLVNSKDEKKVGDALKALFDACSNHEVKDKATGKVVSRLFLNIFNGAQQDAPEFILPLMNILGISDNPEFCLKQVEIKTFQSGNDLKFINKWENDSYLSPLLNLPLVKGQNKSLQSILEHCSEVESLDDFEFKLDDYKDRRLEFIKGNKKELENKMKRASRGSLMRGKELVTKRQLMFTADTKALTHIGIQVGMYNAFDLGVKLKDEAKELLKPENDYLELPVTDTASEEEMLLKFRRKSMCFHSGQTAKSGHYSAAVKHEKDGQEQWQYHNDSSVSDIGHPSEEVSIGEPYMMFYERVWSDN